MLSNQHLVSAAYALLAHLCAWKAGGKYFAAIDRNYDEKELWDMAEKACTKVIESPIYDLLATPEEVCASVLTGIARKESL